MTADYICWRQFGFEELKRGHLALWNPHLLCGAPFFGDFESALLYPPNWLFMVLSLPFALNLSVALHVFLAGWFTYLWISRRGSHPASALMASFMFMMGGAYFLHVVPGHLPNLCAMVWIPLIFLAVEGWREDRGRRWLLLGMFALALQIFSGHVQYSYYTVVVAACYALLNLPGTKEKKTYLGGLSLMGMGAGLLAAVQVLAGWEASMESLRGHKLSLGMANMAAMTPERLWCLLMPGFFGGWRDYWGGGFYWEGVTFVSLAGFVLALYALKASPHPQKKILAGLSLALVILAVGNRTPLFALFHDYFPLFGNFRGVGKLNILIALFLSALAAMGLDEAFKNPGGLKGLAKGLGWGCLALFTAALAFEAAPYLGGGKLFKAYIAHQGQMVESLVLCGVLLGALGLLAFFGRKRPYLGYGFLVLSFFELFIFARQNMPSFNFNSFAARTAPIQKTYREDPGVYRVLGDPFNYFGTASLDIWGEDPAIPARYARFVALTQHGDPEVDFFHKFIFKEFPPAMGLTRLRYVFTEEGGVLKARRTGLREAPRAFFTDHWEVLKEEDALKKTSDSSFDFSREVLLESEPGLSSDAGKLSAALTVTDISSDLIEVTARVSKPAVLVLSDNYSAGWRVRPFSPGDPASYRVMPANGFQRAVPLPAGSHHFYLEYRPSLFGAGKWVSIFSWAGFLGLLASTRRKRTGKES